ncbi:MAG: hypothetical protein A3E82_05595 [Gammaproteobacteria bacterium RIFCSPHIGHO2_12_FULL_38_11]|nr:MAG: hypothetical protein A3E82_05595 [Gammaproteobacteria bacterium RIFCSPHIGHO2_12_FULL_38_11]
MQAHTKKRLTKAKVANVIWRGAHYAVPFAIIEKYKIASNDTDASTIDEVFSDLFKQYGKQGVLLKGLRHKEGLSQIDLAEMLDITQSNLSAMENGRRSIGKEIAKRIEKKFGLDYRLFL